MTNYNLLWDICEVYWNQRFPAPVECADDHIGNSRTNLRQLSTPGMIQFYRKPYRSTPMMAAIQMTNKKKQEDLKYIDDNITKGLFYGIQDETEKQADLQAEEAFQKTVEKNDGNTFKTRLESLYPLHVETHTFIVADPARVDEDRPDEDSI